ncbi:MAG: Cas10/Cmr2 second palm domain-containing protein [Desulfatiglandales bacterium]
MDEREHRCLVVLDIDRIQDYVFNPPRLKLIRNASLLIEYFVQQLNKTKGVNGIPPKVVYARGGGAEILFKDTDEGHAFVKEVEGRFQRDTGIATITGHAEEWKAEESPGKWQERAMTMLQLKKRGKQGSSSLLSSLYTKSCEECGLNPATSKVLRDRYLCRACAVKNEFSKNFPSEKQAIVKYLEAKYGDHISLTYPDEFDQISDQSKPANYLALVYVDVNRMGEHKKAQNDFGRITHFSCLVEKALFEATASSIVETINPSVYVPFPVAFCIAGGDDIVFVLPADWAIPVALNLCDKFEKLQQEGEKWKGYSKITISVGVAIAKGNFPFASMLDMAKQLLRSAKRKNWRNLKPEDESTDQSTLDFQLLGSGLQSLEDIRGRDREVYPGFADCRPLSLKEMGDLVSFVKELKDKGVPLGRFKALYRSLCYGPEQALLDYCLMLTRLKDEQRKIFRSCFPDNDKGFLERIPAILELYDFL